MVFGDDGSGVFLLRARGGRRGESGGRESDGEEPGDSESGDGAERRGSGHGGGSQSVRAATCAAAARAWPSRL